MARHIGISGFSLYTPSLCVSLEDFCTWYGHPWDKVRNVVGRSFRQPGPDESVYTMAATAALRLIEQYGIDPREVGFLALGTESSTDNAAGAVIVRGMLDQALAQKGMPTIARSCEVPEVKHACLGGVYALKAAARFLATDGAGRKAIVVCADIAEYERGSSGEQTQGCGAVAMLVEEDPTLLRVDLTKAGSSSDYRGLDFRKPAQRHRVAGYAPSTHRLHDFPVFNGKYSTFCYLEAVTSAVDDLVARTGEAPMSLLGSLAAIFMHRPYHHMPQSGIASIYVNALVRDRDGAEALGLLAEAAGVSLEDALGEIVGEKRLFELALDRGIDVDPHPAATALAKAARKTPDFTRLVDEKMHLGSDIMRDLGNLYSAALPAWIAAGLEDATKSGVELAGERILAVGYGSGDAAEALLLEVAPGWELAARRIRFREALEQPRFLTRYQYEKRHDGEPVELPLPRTRSGFFVVEKVGDRVEADNQDVGIEYYRYLSA